MKKLILLFTICFFFSFKSFSQDAMLAEIRMFGGNFAPRGWAFCEGQLLPISQNTALFALLGTMYGGDGRTTFALPDLRDAVPVSSSSAMKQGSTANATYLIPNGTQNPNATNLTPDGTQNTKTVKLVAIRYIIALQGTFPMRN